MPLVSGKTTSEPLLPDDPFHSGEHDAELGIPVLVDADDYESSWPGWRNIRQVDYPISCKKHTTAGQVDMSFHAAVHDLGCLVFVPGKTTLPLLRRKSSSRAHWPFPWA